MITLTNPRVLAFYERTKLDPNDLNERIVDLMESTMLSAPETETARVVRGLADAQRAQTESITTALDTARAALAADASERALHLSRASDQLAERMSHLLSRTHDDTVRRVHDDVAAIQRDAQRSDPAFLASVELKVMSQLQPLAQLLQATREEQIGHRAKDERMREQLGDFLQAMHVVQKRGSVSEKQLGAILVELFPTAAIVDTTGKTASGDFFLKRVGKPTILVENKNYTRNVDRCEVDKFVRDVSANRCSGLFLSQRTGLVGKNDFEIDIQDGCVLLYAHAVDMDAGRIRAAVTIIDSLSTRLEALVETESATGVVVSRAALDDMNAQYRAFEKNRDSMLVCLKDYCKSMQANIAALEVPALVQYLETAYGATTASLACAVCQKQFTSARGLATHMRAHKND